MREGGPSPEEMGLKPEDTGVKPEPGGPKPPEEIKQPESESSIGNQIARTRENARLPQDMKGCEFHGFEFTPDGGIEFRAKIDGEDYLIKTDKDGLCSGSMINPDSGEHIALSVYQAENILDKVHETSRLSLQQEAYHRKKEAGQKPAEDEVQFLGFQRQESGVTVYFAEIGGTEYRVQDQGLQTDGKTRNLLGSRIEGAGMVSLGPEETRKIFEQMRGSIGKMNEAEPIRGQKQTAG